MDFLRTISISINVRRRVCRILHALELYIQMMNILVFLIDVSFMVIFRRPMDFLSGIHGIHFQKHKNFYLRRLVDKKIRSAGDVKV